MLLSIVIPAYNEEQRISDMLDKYLPFYQSREAEFIVVLNGCTDNTLGVVTSYQKRFPQLRYRDIAAAVGKGGAIKAGFQEARGERVGFVDADGSTDPEEFDRLVRQLDRYDGAIASRWKRGSVVLNRNVLRKSISWAFVLAVKLLFALPFTDTQCGAKVFRRNVIQRITPTLRVGNMATDVEILYRALKAGFRIVEIPTRWVDKSSSSMLGSPLGMAKNAIGMLLTLFRIKFS